MNSQPVWIKSDIAGNKLHKNALYHLDITFSYKCIFSPCFKNNWICVDFYEWGIYQRKSSPHLSAGWTCFFYYHFSYFHWGEINYSLCGFWLQNLTFHLTSVGSAPSTASSPLFQPAPLISCGRHFCPSSDILCSCDLYSTPQPLSLSAPFCPIHFHPLVALAHSPFVSRMCRQKDTRTHA